MDASVVLTVIVASLFGNADSTPVFDPAFEGSVFASVGKNATFSFRFTGAFEQIDFGLFLGGIIKPLAIRVTNSKPLKLDFGKEYIGRIFWAGNVAVSPKEAVFVLSNVSQSDSGEYGYMVTEGFSSTPIRPVQLTVTDANIVEHPKDAICPTNGGEVNFTCNATGTPHPNVTWLKNGKEIGESSSFKFMQDGKGYSKLTVKNCGREDVLARYRCKATNPPDLEVMSKNAILFSSFTNDAREVDKYSSPLSVTGSIGVETTLRCAFRSYPPPSINWTLPNGDSTQTQLPFLVINLTSSEQFGKYTCSADGFTSRTINLAGVAGNDTTTTNGSGTHVLFMLGPTLPDNGISFYTVTGRREETNKPFLAVTKNSSMNLYWNSEVENIEDKNEKVTLILVVRYHADISTKVIKRLRVVLVAKARPLQAGFLAFLIPLVVALLSAGFQ